MFPSPPNETRTRRSIVPTFPELSKCIQDASIALESHISYILLATDGTTLGSTGQDKALLQELWLKYDAAHKAVLDHLTTQGASEEQMPYKERYQTLSTRAKNASFTLRCNFLANGIDDYSDIDNLSDITSLSQMSVNRRNILEERLRSATVQHITAKKLLDLKSEEKLLEIRLEREKLDLAEKSLREHSNLQLRKIDLKQDSEIGWLEEQLDSISLKEARKVSVQAYDPINEWLETAAVESTVSFTSAPFFTESPCTVSKTSCSSTAVHLTTIYSSPIAASVDIFQQSQPEISTAGRMFPLPSRTPFPNVSTLQVTQASTAHPPYSNASRSYMSSSFSPLHSMSHTGTPHSHQVFRPSFPNDILANRAKAPPSPSSQLDPSTRYLALSQLKQTPASPFDGDPHLFRGWMMSLTHRLSKLQLDSLDIIDVLEAHTTGAPKQLISTLKSAYSHDPDEALAVITKKLRARFSGDVQISSSLRTKLSNFPEISGSQSDPAVGQKLRQLSDLCQCVCAHMSTAHDLQILNYESGVEPIRKKLPEFLNNRWRTSKAHYVAVNGIHPPFSLFCTFLEDQSDILCADVRESIARFAPNYKNENCSRRLHTKVLHTSSDSMSENTSRSFKCSLHRSNTHELKECKAFLDLQPRMRKLLISSYDLCYRCTRNHRASECKRRVNCSRCESSNHISELHQDAPHNLNEHITPQENGSCGSRASGYQMHPNLA